MVLYTYVFFLSGAKIGIFLEPTKFFGEKSEM